MLNKSIAINLYYHDSILKLNQAYSQENWSNPNMRKFLRFVSEYMFADFTHFDSVICDLARSRYPQHIIRLEKLFQLTLIAQNLVATDSLMQTLDALREEIGKKINYNEMIVEEASIEHHIRTAYVHLSMGLLVHFQDRLDSSDILKWLRTMGPVGNSFSPRAECVRHSFLCAMNTLSQLLVQRYVQ